MGDNIRITVWNEFRHEKKYGKAQDVYPNGIHMALKQGLEKQGDFDMRTATLDEPEHGLTENVLADTDVLIWWGHMAHNEVNEAIVTRVQQHVLSGMGLIVLHSGHFSRIFRRMMGTHCSLKWREAGERERLWCIEPSHPIAKGIDEQIVLEHVEMYGERFDIPAPDKVIFMGWFQGGEVFRSGCTFQRGHGRIFYFQPGHETFPIYYNENILRIIANACRWAGRRMNIPFHCPEITEPPENMGGK